MRIGIDARLAGVENGGIGRYIEELLKALLKQDTKHTWVVFLRSHSQLPWLHQYKNARIVQLNVPHYTIREQVINPVMFLSEHLDLLHVPHFNVPMVYRRKFVVTIHDLLWHEVRDPHATTLTPMMHSMKHLAYRKVAEHAIAHASTVIVPSRYVAQAVEHFPHKRVVTVYDGVAKAFQEQKPAKKQGGGSYLLMVGSLYPHKNIPYVLEALTSVKSLRLLLVSGRSVFQERLLRDIERRGLKDRVLFLGKREDHELAELYRNSLALVFPSKSEGFGLPGIEAMASGTPVIASDIPVFREVYGDAALYIDPYDPSDLVRVVTTLKATPDLRRKHIERGRKQALLYSWTRTAGQLLKLYEKA